MRHGTCDECGHLIWNHRQEGGCAVPACECGQHGTYRERGPTTEDECGYFDPGHTPSRGPSGGPS